MKSIIVVIGLLAVSLASGCCKNTCQKYSWERIHDGGLKGTYRRCEDGTLVPVPPQKVPARIDAMLGDLSKK